jgi:hypothetical protein
LVEDECNGVAGGMPRIDFVVDPRAEMLAME